MLSKAVFLIVFLWSVSCTNGQQVLDCAELQIGDLGSSTAPSAQGLLATALARTEPGNTNPSVQVLQFNTVCLSQGSVRDRYSSVSVVVSYRRDGMEATAQVEYLCQHGEWIFPMQFSASLNPNATLSTALRTDCLACSPPGNTFVVTPEEHCAGEDDSIVSEEFFVVQYADLSVLD